MKREAIICQIAAIGAHALRAEFSGSDLRQISVEMTDAQAAIEMKIRKLDAEEERGRKALRQLFGYGPEDGSAA